MVSPYKNRTGKIFGTKAEMLAQVRERSGNFIVPLLSYFSVQEWSVDRHKILKYIAGSFDAKNLAIRSSAILEDSADASMAGQFESVLEVPSNDNERIIEAVETVLKSYDGNPKNQILVQEMVEDIAVSGVIFSHDLNDGAPYIVIDYDDESGRSDAVTGGTGIHKNVRVFRNVNLRNIHSPRLKAAVQLVFNLEDILGPVPIDIEFAIDRDNKIYLLQVRRLATSRKWNSDIENYAMRRIPVVATFIKDLYKPLPGILGDYTILANMPDWNPAEMISPKARPLACSLYRDLITQNIWRDARSKIGYRSMGADELMIVIAGKPFIDVRVSFNSFLPDMLDDRICSALVNAWLNRLKNHPEFHDKIEFEIVNTCEDFCFTDSFAERYPGLLNSTDLTAYHFSLRTLTKKLVRIDQGGSLAWAEREYERLSDHLGPTVGNQSNKSALARLADIRHLVGVAKEGTLAFSIAARHAFIGETMMRSAVRRGAISIERFNAFKISIGTVSSDFSSDMQDVISGKKSRESFLKRYGHLRPGTYDILSPRYVDRDDLFIGTLAFPGERKKPFQLTSEETNKLGTLLNEVELYNLEPEGLLAYAKRAIQAREALKFAFTWYLSEALEHIASWGSIHQIGRDELSFLTIPFVLDQFYAPGSREMRGYLAEIIETKRSEWMRCDAVKLGHFISSIDDIYVIAAQRSAPNFITSKIAEGPIQEISASQIYFGSINETIICVENADPGFDWIFSQNIKALITKFGGANSHMAIRCAEFGIPAAIGCGEELYSRILKSGSVFLDCSNHKIKPLHQV